MLSSINFRILLEEKKLFMRSGGTEVFLWQSFFSGVPIDISKNSRFRRKLKDRRRGNSGI